MRLQKRFFKTLREVGQSTSTGLGYLLRGGFIRESSAGRYYFLEPGVRVHRAIVEVIREEMEHLGGQEITTPSLHPRELWEETNRDKAASFELMGVTDRGGRQFVLGGTAEEMVIDLVRRFEVTYKDLPFCLFQFSQKFRDELRARGGLLRTREFVMKDAYSFHESEESMHRYYEQMGEAYHRIFDRLGLPVSMVQSDNGIMGGKISHEFIAESPLGESVFFESSDGSYRAHEEVATFQRTSCNQDEIVESVRIVSASRGPSIADGVAFYGQPAWRQIKSILYFLHDVEPVLVCIRGDLKIHEKKLKEVLGTDVLRVASEEEVIELGSVPGFISPLKLKVKKVGDLSLSTVKNFITGADEFHKDTHGVQYGRDFIVEVLADIAEAEEGFLSESTGSPLKRKEGIEVGNIFELGLHYSEKMKGTEFLSAENKRCPLWMGCYGIGIGRTMQALAEQYSDASGLLWPEVIAPWKVLITQVGKGDAVKESTLRLYKKLSLMKVPVLIDDRECSPGVKFADGDLLGIPYRVVISDRSLGQRGVSLKLRTSSEEHLLSEEEVVRKFS